MSANTPPAIRYTPMDPSPLANHRHLLFARGWYITNDERDFYPAGWGRFSFGRQRLTFDRRLELIHVGDQNGSITILGHAIDLRNDTSILEAIAANLYRARSESRESYFEALNWLAGRYLVIDSFGDATYLQSDAVGMRSVYYHAEQKVIASHQNLVMELAGVKKASTFGSEPWRQANKTAVCYPGNETHWDGVKFLNANHELNIDTLSARRVPLAPPEELTTVEVAGKVLALVQKQIPHLTKNKKPVVSLTAGQDSRSTLAALRPVKNAFTYFTYALTYSRRWRAVKLDTEGSQKVAYIAELDDYKLLSLDGPLKDQALIDIIKRNSIKTSNPNVAGAYLAELSQADMHIRSSFNEIGIAAYRTKYGHRELTAELLADILTFEKGYTSETVEACQNYLDDTGMMNVPGYDPFDLWYWEIRMGSWLGSILHESDIAFDTHILVGCREIVRLLLSAPVDERGQVGTYDHLINTVWPELYEVPVNGKSRLPTSV